LPPTETLSTADFLAESRRRAALIETKRHRLRSIMVSAGSAVAGLAVVVTVALVLSFVPLNASGRGGTASGTATAIGPSDAGAYVLVGIVCFALGVIVTLLSTRYAARHRSGPQPDS